MSLLGTLIALYIAYQKAVKYNASFFVAASIFMDLSDKLEKTLGQNQVENNRIKVGFYYKIPISQMAEKIDYIENSIITVIQRYNTTQKEIKMVLDI